MNLFFFLWRCGPTRARAFSFSRFLDHTQRYTTGGRNPLYEWSAPPRELYLTTQNTRIHAPVGIFLSPSIIAVCPRTFSNRVWRSLLMACRKYIQWHISYLSSFTIDWVWFVNHEVSDHTHGRTTVGRTPLDEWPARRRDLYLTTHNTHNRHAPGGIRTHNLNRQAAAHLRPRLRDHWDWPNHAIRWSICSGRIIDYKLNISRCDYSTNRLNLFFAFEEERKTNCLKNWQ